MSQGGKKDDFDPAERQALDGMNSELEAVRDRHKNDPPIEMLRAGRANVLPEELQDDVSRHLEQSPWSSALVEGAEEVEPEISREDQDRLLSRIQSEARKEKAPRSIWALWWRPALAFGVIALVAVAIWRWQAGQRPSQNVTQAPPVQQPAPVKPAFLLALEKPEIRFTENTIVVRGSGGQNGLLNALAPGINAFRENDYAGAEKKLSGLEQRYPHSVEVFFYLGVSRLFLNDAPGAIRALEQARRLREKSFAADVAWYMAVAEERAGKLQDAQRELNTLCQGKSSYAERGCDGLNAFARQSGGTSPR